MYLIGLHLGINTCKSVSNETPKLSNISSDHQSRRLYSPPTSTHSCSTTIQSAKSALFEPSVPSHTPLIKHTFSSTTSA